MADAPPRPPPHSPKPSNLPDGNYDIFIIPPHSAGSGFLYLPSLKPNVNSFVAGFFTALLAVGIYNVLMPALSQTIASLNSGIGFFFALIAVAAAFSIGRTASDSSGGSNHHGSPFNEGPQYPRQSAPPPQPGPPPPQPGPQSAPQPPPHSPKPGPSPTASSGWEKAREETRRREQERKKAEEAKAAAEAAARKKEEAEKAARAQAEKERWEQARAREKDTREREARERIAKERAAREAAAAAAATPGSPRASRYEKPTARTATDSDFASHYQRPKQAYGSSAASSVSGASESSYASVSTARTSPPPPSNRGPYKTADPNKIVVQAVYQFAAGFARPLGMLVRDQGGVTDGLILRITTEGLFIDDDVRGVPQREWDVKAWSIKLVETGRLNDVHVFRATLRDVDEKKYIFVLPAEQSWKVDVGLERLRKGSQVRAMGMNMIKEPEMKKILAAVAGLGV